MRHMSKSSAVAILAEAISAQVPQRRLRAPLLECLKGPGLRRSLLLTSWVYSIAFLIGFRALLASPPTSFV